MSNYFIELGGELKLQSTLREVLLQTVVGRDRLQIVVGQSHPWFHRPVIQVEDLRTTPWVLREAGSGAQQVFEQALQNWGVDLSQLNVMLVLSSSEMVKAVVERGSGAAAIPELMVYKELQLKTLKAVQVFAGTNANTRLEIVQPILQLKHAQRFQTQTMIAFEKILQQQMVVVDSLSMCFEV